MSPAWIPAGPLTGVETSIRERTRAHTVVEHGFFYDYA